MSEYQVMAVTTLHRVLLHREGAEVGVMPGAMLTSGFFSSSVMMGIKGRSGNEPQRLRFSSSLAIGE